MRISDWSSDVCSSDLRAVAGSAGSPIRRKRRDHADGHGVPGRRRTAAGHADRPRGGRADGRRPGDASALGLHYGPDSARAADRSEEHTSELQSLMRISYAVFCLKKKIKHIQLSLIHILYYY